MDILTMVAQILLSLSILVGLHEFGHLITAKIFGMRVEQFSIGFPPKLFGFKYKDTVYSLGAIPLGGFVKITGMIDESLDTEYKDRPPQPYEFRSKPAWQRLIVMMGGIVVNVILGIFIFVMITFYYGDEYISKEEMNQHGIVAHELGQKLGLQTGDKVIAVNGNTEFGKMNDLLDADAVLLGDQAYYTVLRNGQEVRVELPDDLADQLADYSATSFFTPRSDEFYIAAIGETENSKRSPAKEAGLQEGDQIVSVAGMTVNYHDEFIPEISEKLQAEYGGKTIDVVVLRDGEQLTRQLTLDQAGFMGIATRPKFNWSTQKYSFGQSISLGTARAFGVIWLNMKALGRIFSGRLSAQKSLSGPIDIAKKLFGGVWVWQNFWNITGMLSMVLAFMNFLPIPALDGGHVMFITYEIISGRKPSDKFLENAQKVGMVFLLALMAFVIGNDIFKQF